MKLQPVRVGDAFQAEIPALLSAEEQEKQRREALVATSRCKQQWNATRFAEEEVTEFLRSYCRLNEVETGLQCLHDGDYDVAKAVQLINGSRRRKLRKQRQRLEAVSEEQFEHAVLKYGKKFFLIQRELNKPQLSTSDIVGRFYEWKTSTAYARWRERVKARKNKERARLRQWDESDESDHSDFHNEYCELCFTGGQLLCCDGCERAFHFSCVSPPIKDVPKDDWFCSHCTSIMNTMLSEDLNESPDAFMRLTARTHTAEERSPPSSYSDGREGDHGIDIRDRRGIRAEHVTSPSTTTAGTDSDFSDGGGKAGDIERSAPQEAESSNRKQATQRELPSRSFSPGPPSSAVLPTELIDNGANGRKRQRKITMPRRIPQRAMNK
ncbi:TPA: hypothetical protein N0F65_006454 [Lagenidium giganteum]|uniref:PHD-type domain-containing protein n=1 Tax=Lagenidium giganteum TaxID=4803 RepID=A0AAV2Z4D4_9STRA|nr:TPA: hypothetical protein N0F65_006454 [Lagenidium giganteum]